MQKWSKTHLYLTGQWRRNIQKWKISHVVKAGEVPSCNFYSKGDEADDSCDPHQTLQPSSQLPGKLHILWSSLRRLQFIGTISFQDLTGKGGGQTLGMNQKPKVTTQSHGRNRGIFQKGLTLVTLVLYLISSSSIGISWSSCRGRQTALMQTVSLFELHLFFHFELWVSQRYKDCCCLVA